MKLFALKMKKKSQGISINTIIIAALGLAVLVVLFAIFTGRLGIFTSGLKATDTCTQKCSSLNSVVSSNPSSADAKACPEGDTYVAGEASDSKFGCCCKPKT